MARAIRAAVEAGRLARGAGRIPRRLHAQASTPEEGLPDFVHARRRRRAIDEPRSTAGRPPGRAATARPSRELCAPDVHYEDPLSGEPLEGPDALGDHAARLWAAFPDARIERTGERLSDGRFVAAPCKLLGTHRGELAGLPPTERFVVVHVVCYCELDPPRERLLARARLLRPLRRRGPARRAARARHAGRARAAAAARLRAARAG